MLPEINAYWERAEVRLALCRRLGELGLVGDGIEGYGCPPMSRIAGGWVNMELGRGDGSLGTFSRGAGRLAMRSIAMLGSEEQKQRFLPPMACLEKIGAFGLTEPAHGTERRAGDEPPQGRCRTSSTATRGGSATGPSPT